MSDLSRLRARWIRLERRIDNLNAQWAEDPGDELIVAKIVKATATLELTIKQTGAEERRLIAADTKLRFTNV